ncbi:MAG: CpsD/CapB family tyrosine-protein kinase [Nitrospirae bacterium]|nr:CpsD/CapB family tyrosine-protein kinase [Nitrospirota bacterium]
MDRNLIIHPKVQQAWDEDKVTLERWQVPRYSAAEEQFRVLATRLRTMLGQPGAPGRVVALTSALPGEGKTLNCVNLATVLARDFEYRALLLEADLKRPAIGRGNRHIPGLIEYVSGEVPLKGVIRGTAIEGLSVLTAGRAENPLSTQVLGSALLQRTMLRLRESFDFVVVDCPPMLAASDLGLVAEWTDHFLLVVKAGTTDRSVVKSSMECLPKGKFLGAVLSDTREQDDRYRYGTY